MQHGDVEAMKRTERIRKRLPALLKGINVSGLPSTSQIAEGAAGMDAPYDEALAEITGEIASPRLRQDSP